MIHPALVNPWFSLGESERFCTDFQVSEQSIPAAIPDDGFSARENLRKLLREGREQEIDPDLLREAQAALDRMEGLRTFEPDEYAFMAEIEPVPEFIRRAVG